ncbi:hypothetical protein ABZ904_38865, partial [Streptomyces sp. NPDC046900]|uniref:hypothetical protein n=1 Tax=Streptomyces sp. NPDC046900 TaxID=3155473 RepID=UPI0033CF5B69
MPDLVGENGAFGDQRMLLVLGDEPLVAVRLGGQVLGQPPEPVLLGQHPGGAELGTRPEAS